MFILYNLATSTRRNYCREAVLSSSAAFSVLAPCSGVIRYHSTSLNLRQMLSPFS